MDTGITILAVLLGYLLGSISAARIVGKRVAPGEDLGRTPLNVPGTDETFEMRTVSATSISMRKGPKLGCLTSILDMVKVTVPTLAFRWLYPEQPYFLVTAAAGVLGHNFPVYYRFKGGRGISAVWGGLLVFDPLAIIGTNILSNLLGLLVFRDVLIAYSGGLLLLIPWLWFRFQSWPFVAYAVAVNVLFWVSMHYELRMYIKFKREGKTKDMLAIVEQTDMGRGLKYLRKYGLIKEKPAADSGTIDTAVLPEDQR